MFVKIKTLGIGAFGEVCLTRKVDTGGLYAMKTLRKKDVLNRNQVTIWQFGISHALQLQLESINNLCCPGGPRESRARHPGRGRQRVGGTSLLLLPGP